MFIGTHSHLHLKYRNIPSPFLWMYSNGTRFVQTLRDDHIAEGAIESGHLNHIKALISPIDVAYLYKTTQCVRCTNIQCAFNCVFAHLHTCNPVHGDAFHTSNAIGHYVLPPGLVSLGSANSAKAHVNPVDGVILYRAK